MTSADASRAKGRRLGRRVLRQIATIVTPDTIPWWHRQLIARKWTFEPTRAGRPGIRPEISSLIVRLATEKPAWGSTRIRGALKNLGPGVARSTIATVLKHHGLSPAPDRSSSWRTFLRSHWGQIAGADFVTSEVWTCPSPKPRRLAWRRSVPLGRGPTRQETGGRRSNADQSASLRPSAPPYQADVPAVGWWWW